MKHFNEGRVSTAAIIVMSSMIISRLTGFLRETVLSWKVGLSWVQDSYVAAFAVPDLICTLLVGGTISAVLVPFLSGKLETGEEVDGWRAVSSFINIIFISVFLLCIIGVIFAPQLIPVVAPGFSTRSVNAQQLSIKLLRILFPSVIFIMSAGICNGVLNSYKKFAAAAYGYSIYNIGCAISIFVFADTNEESMIRVALGVAASAAVYFLVQFIFAFRRLRFYKPIIDLAGKGFRTLFGNAAPSLLSSSISQINMVISTAFVSLSAIEGSLAAFRNANTLWQLPYGIFAMGMGTAVLPSLAGRFARGEKDEFEGLLMKSLKSVLFVAIPSAAGFIVLREPLVRAVFKWGGRFTEHNVPFVASILALFSISMVSQSVAAIMNRAFFAGQDTLTPFLTGLASMILNLGTGAALFLFAVPDPSAMALSYSVTSTVNAALLLFLSGKKTNAIRFKRLPEFVLKSVFAALCMCALLFLLESSFAKPEIKAVQLLYLTVEIVIGAILYIAVMIALKAEEAFYFIRIIRRQFPM